MPDISASSALVTVSTMSSTRSPMRYAHSDGHTDLCYSEDLKLLITCGSDGDVRLWADLEDDDPSSQCVGEHAFAVALQGQRLLVGNDSHMVQAYTLPGLERDGVVTRFTAHATHISVAKGLIAAGSKDMEIHVVSTTSTEATVILGHAGPILGVALDPLGVYLASSAGDGTIRVWRLSDSSETSRWALPPCTALAACRALGRCGWASDGAVLVVPRAQGKVAVVARDSWTEMRELVDPASTEHTSIAAFSGCGRLVAASSSSGHVSVWRSDDGALISSTPHARGTNVTALAWVGPAQLALCDALGQLGTIDLPSQVLSVDIEKGPVLTPFNLLEDDVDDGLFAAAPRAMSPDFDDVDIGSVNGAGSRVDSRVESRAVSRAESRAEFRDETQPPFQPGSSPEHLQHRYLVWNGVGVVKAQRTETESAIDVELHDAAVHHALRLRNPLGHAMAAVTTHALALACPAHDDEPSQLEVRLWSGGEWRLRLPQNEEALALTAGADFIALATDRRCLRLLRLRGGQREVVALPGATVALAAHRDLLAVVVNSAAGTGSGPALSVSVTRVRSTCLRAVGPAWMPLPLSPHATLQWLGFTDEGALAAVDSAGVLRLRNHGDGWWRQVADFTQHVKGVSDHIFVVGISERFATVQGVTCRGSRYPPTMPRPPTQELPLQLPLCEPDTEQTVLESGFWLRATLEPSLSAAPECADELAENRSRQDEALLKLFALAARGGFEGRALALVPLMPSNVCALAVKYAGKIGKFALADRVDDIAAAEPLERSPSPEPTPTEDAYPSPDVESLLVHAPREPTVVVRPCLMASAKRSRNPFKRAPAPKLVGTGLAQLEDKAAQRIGAAAAQSAAAAVKPAAKPLRQSALTKAAAMPFPKWFASNRAALELEHPELSAAELCKLATEQYKAANKKALGIVTKPAVTNGAKANGDASESQTNESQSNESQGNESQSNDLQAQEAQDNGTEVDSQNQDKESQMSLDDDDFVEGTQLPEPTNRKRRLESPEAASAPSKLTSKLTAFAFKKT